MEDGTPSSDAPAKPGLFYRLNFFKRKPAPVPGEREVCPEHTAGVFSLLTFQWMSHIMTASRNPTRAASIKLLT